MSFEITNLAYDSSTKTNTLNKITTTTGTTERTSVTQMTPYVVDMQLNIMAKNQDDALQILEQIVPTFQPVYNLSVKLLDDIDKSFDVPITLQSVTLNDDYEGDYTTRRVLIYTLDFSIKIKFFGDTTKSGIITQVIANMFEQGGTEHYVTEYVEPYSADKNYKTAKATAVITNGEVTDVIINDGGSGYRGSVPTVTFSQSNTNATPEVGFSYIDGILDSPYLIAKGFGYESVPNISISAPYAPAAAILETKINETSGQVDTIYISVDSPGYQGYLNVPDITIAAPTGIQAEASITGSELNENTNLVVLEDGYTQGLGYFETSGAFLPPNAVRINATIDPPPIAGLMSDATATCTLAPDNTIDTITITDPGAYYNPKVYYSLTATDPDGTEYPAGTAILTDQGNGVYGVDSVNTNGLGEPTVFTGVPTLTFAENTIDKCTATVNQCVTDIAGRITRIVVNVTESYYYDENTDYDITFESPNDLQTATAEGSIDLVNGIVDGVNLTGLGKGYASAPSVTVALEDTNNYITATATCTINSNTEVATITLTNPGDGYFPRKPPVFTFDAPAADVRATGTAVVSNGSITDITITEGGFGYETPPLITIEAPSPTRVIGDNEALLTYSFVKPDSEFTLYSDYAQNPNQFFTVGEKVYGGNTGSEGEVISCVYDSLNTRVVTVINYITGYFEIGENLVGDTSGVVHEISSYIVE